jgi:hypothetical protein
MEFDIIEEYSEVPEQTENRKKKNKEGGNLVKNGK